MTEQKLDRRVQRTRSLLNKALMDLIQEKGYDNVTIEDITERANLGRTTFYLHYQSKDDLLIDHHDDLASQLNLDSLNREQLLGAEPQAEMVAFLQQLNQSVEIYEAFTKAKEAAFIMHNVRERTMNNLRESLTKAFPETVPSPPLELLAQYIVGAQFSLLDWWVTNETAYTPEQVATMLHQLRSAIVRDAYGIDTKP